MKIHRLQIKNMFQHESLDIVIDGNLVGLVGPNGSGKSNLLKSIQFAFSGEVPGKNKEQLLRWGAQSGYCRVHFTHQGESGVLTRGVGGGKTELEYANNKTKGITAVNQAVDACLNMDKDIARTVFVAQAELDSVLFDRAGQREQAFQRMCGIGDAAKVHKVLGQWLSEKMPEVTDTDAQIAQAIVELESLDAAQAECLNLGKALDTQLVEFDPGLMQERQHTCAERQRTCTELQRIARDINERVPRLTSLQAELETLKGQTSGIPLDAIDQRISSAEQLLSSAEKYTSLAAALRKAQEKSANVGERPVSDDELSQLEKAIVNSTALSSELRGLTNLYSGLLSTLKSSSADLKNCPVCGSDIVDADSVTHRLETLIADNQKRDAELGLATVQQTLNEKRAALNNWADTQRSVSNEVATTEAALRTVSPVEINVEQQRKELSLMRQVRSDLTTALQRTASAEASLTAETSEVERLKVRSNELVQYLITLGVDSSETGESNWQKVLDQAVLTGSQITRDIQRCNELSKQKATNKGRLDEILSRTRIVKSGLESLEAKQSQFASYNQAKHALETVRSWLHYSNGPHRLAVNVMEGLTDGVNMFLQKMNSPFYAIAEESDLSYRCPFTDGRTMPESGAPDASELSGGQKTMLALAFRLSSYCMFASRQGLLALDEPTAYLDGENVANFCTLLEKLKEIMQELDLQVFLSSHEQAVLPFCDTIVNLYDRV